MAINKDITSPKKGMNRDKSSFDLDNTEYSFMLNGNFHDEHGSGQVNLQNEPSNVYCSGFKEGYKVIGHKFDINKDVTYFFLTNPQTGCSEIGYISSFHNIDGLDQVEETCNCNISVIIENALETQTKVATCQYFTIISDECTVRGETTCTGCLGFNINSPIHESNIQIKDESTGRVLYWTDFDNPPRYLQLDRISQYYQDEDTCTGEVIETCLQCDKLRVFKLFNKPCLKVETIQNGGNLKAGMYEVLIAYSSQSGDEISDYYSLTNPVPIFDENNNILDQTNLDYNTNLVIKIRAIDLDQKYEFFKIAVIYKSGLDESLSVRGYGVYPITADTVSIVTLNDKEVKSLPDVLGRRVVYNKSRGLASGNGYLFHYGMEAHREINLQPVVNLLGSMVKWSTVQANEDIYKNGAHVSNYLGYMRDEVVPLSIKFYEDGGYETANFPFIARPPKATEIEELGAGYDEDSNNQSVLDNAPPCSGNLRNKRWQFENTAEKIGDCLVPDDFPGGTVEVPVDETTTCFVVDESGDIAEVANVANGTIAVGTGVGVVQYINENIDNIIASTDSSFDDIRDVLTDTYPEHCTPEFGSNCGPVSLTLEEVLAISVETEEVTRESIPFEEYTDHPEAPKEEDCPNGGDPDPNTGATPLVEDTTFQTTYMRPGEIVYIRNFPINNTSCSASSTIPIFTNPALPSAIKLGYAGSLGSTGGNSALQTSLTVSTIDLPNGFTNKLHTNARWFKIDFGGLDSMAFELSPAFIGWTDDVCQPSLRVSFFNGCSATTDIAGTGAIIYDVSLANDPTKFITLDASDFGGPNSTAYVAIDSPIIVDAYWEVTLTDSGASGGDTIDITIDSIIYPVTFNTDLTTTASNFVASFAATILSDHDIIVTSMGGSIFFRSLESQFTSAIVDNFSGGLEGTKVTPPIETYHVLSPPCGCIGVYYRQIETREVVVFTGLSFGKRETYTSTCIYSRPDLKGCDPIPYEYGLFSYWESIERYPCNGELYNSEDLDVYPSTLATYMSAAEITEFEDYYVDGGSSFPGPILKPNGAYKLINADFRDQPIRHYKFPCSTKVPFMSTSTQNPGAFKESVVYPIGFSLSNSSINAFLDVAVANGLMTLPERAKITKYEIFRGDRSVDKGIIAKGLLFDIYSYSNKNFTIEHYPNYPLNSLGLDQLNGGVNHRGGSTRNNLFTFHSPETSFSRPTLPNEMKIEGYQFGKSATYFDTVKDYPTYVILGSQAYDVATGLATAEVTLDLLIQGLSYTMEGIASGTYIGVAGGIILAVVIILALVAGMFRIGELRYEWIETFRSLGHPHNFAYYSATIGHYSYFIPNSLPDERLRGIPKVTYLNEGLISVPNEVTGESLSINNLDREKSVFVNLGETYWLNYPSIYSSYDVAPNPVTSSRRRYAEIGRSGRIIANAASPYVSLKQYLPAQYGQIQSIDWIYTGFCGDITESIGCNPIFGGDTYISRFALKRKIPFFTANSHGLAPRTPFEHSAYFNINPSVDTGRYYVDYLINNDNDNKFWMFVFPANKSKVALDYNLDPDGFYIKPPAKFYLYSYGFPYFLVESSINCNYRYAKREIHENFYPNFGDVIENTQESNVSIREPNTYFYNFVYSGRKSKYAWRLLPDTYNAALYAGLVDLDNTTIYSLQDNSEASLTDPWLIYKALDSYTFPKTFGRLIDMDSIESEAILARFDNGVTLFGAIDQLRDRLTPDTGNIGSGGIFAGRSINFNKTDLGYGGTQHITKVSCEFGHFWCDAKRGQVFHMKPNGEGFDEITKGLEKWFKENLPFKILQYVQGLTQRDIDNTYKGLGLTMGWDARLKRVFITKLDYIPIVEGIEYNGQDFYILEDKRDPIIISLTDTNYFKECSFTVAFSPLTATWISYYSFKPNYYIAYNNYFQTGVNYSVDTTEEGLWSHLPFLSSYQVFYGKIHPWIIESSFVSKNSNSVLNSIEYWMDVRKYYSKYDFADVFGYGFNKAFIYNSQQNSGQLNLVHQKNNDLRQSLTYPKHNSDSIDILQTEINGKWSFNTFYNLIKNERGGLPIWIYDCSQINKDLDNRLLDYRPNYKDRLRGDYFMLRLQQDAESRYKMIYRFGVNERDYYNQ